MRTADVRSLAFVFTTLALLLIPFGVPNIPPAAAAAWILLNSFFAFTCCVVNHNHMHCPTFKNENLNLTFNILLALSKGHTATTIVVPHMYNHHIFHGNKADWTRPALAGEGRLIPRIFKYIWNASRTMAFERRQPDAPKLSSLNLRNIKIERALLFLFMGGIFILNPLKAVLFVGIPWILAMCSLVAINFLQHDGCDPDSRFNNSRNFTGRLGNWMFMNNGYHTAHHLAPAMHWSDLPALHAKAIAPRMRSDLNENSILLYVLREQFKPAAATFTGDKVLTS